MSSISFVEDGEVEAREIEHAYPRGGFEDCFELHVRYIYDGWKTKEQIKWQVWLYGLAHSNLFGWL